MRDMTALCAGKRKESDLEVGTILQCQDAVLPPSNEIAPSQVSSSISGTSANVRHIALYVFLPSAVIDSCVYYKL
jgi:hypothetical protein